MLVFTGLTLKADGSACSQIPISSNLDAGDKNKREGLVGEIMIEKKPIAK